MQPDDVAVDFARFKVESDCVERDDSRWWTFDFGSPNFVQHFETAASPNERSRLCGPVKVARKGHDCTET